MASSLPPARCGAVVRRAPARPQPAEKADRCGRAAAETVQRKPVTAVVVRRTWDAGGGEMVHQAEEERQVAGSNALLVQRQNEGAAVGFEKEVAVLDALGDALARDDRSDVVLGDERFEFLVGNFRIDGNGERQATRTRGSLNSTLSRVTVTSRS